MESIDYLTLLMRWLHIFAAMVTAGGAVFLWLALLPGAAEALDDPAREKLRDAVIKRWKKIVHAGVGILLLTGGVNFYRLALQADVNPMPYHALFSLKFFAALFVFFIAIALTGRSPGTAGMRKQSAKWLSVLTGVTLLIVLLSGVLAQLRTAP